MPISRRKFLQVAGLTLGASVINVLPTYAAGVQWVGAVMPATPAAQHWFAGLQRHLRTQNAHGLRTVYGATPSHALESVEKSARRSLAALVAFGTPAQYPDLQLWAAKQNLPLWFSTLGANVSEVSVNTVSLNMWQANYAFGRTAARAGTAAFLAASAHDAGYDALYALQAGFEHAGGTVLETGLSHTPNATDGNLPAVLQAIARTQPNVVLAAYQGSAAREFVAAYQQAGLRAPLWLSGTAAEFTPSGAWTWAVRGSRRSASTFTALGEQTAQTILGTFFSKRGEISAPQFELRQTGTFLNQPQRLEIAPADEFLRALAPIRSGWLMDYGTF
ncbi:MAG: ABC transporter substrate-binding protein [Anaerolineales bacterium]|nr:ABC transporter substrate-binding protein [Anaerolineales bacterium]